MLQTESPSALYEQDETAWLEIVAEFVAHKRFADLDHKNVSEKLYRFPKQCAWEVDEMLSDD